MIAAFVLFLSLGLDTFAVALSLGIAGLPRARWIRVGLSFALFEGLMPVVGLLIGRHLSGILGEVAAYTAAGLLMVLGGYEIREALRDDDTEQAGTGAHPVAMPGVGLGSTLFRGLSSVSTSWPSAFPSASCTCHWHQRSAMWRSRRSP